MRFGKFQNRRVIVGGFDAFHRSEHRLERVVRLDHLDRDLQLEVGQRYVLKVGRRRWVEITVASSDAG